VAQIWKKKLQKDEKIIQLSKWKIIEQKKMQTKIANAYVKTPCSKENMKME
jgi:hypothetical protein